MSDELSREEMVNLKKGLVTLLTPYSPNVQLIALADAIAMHIANLQPKPPFDMSKEQLHVAALERHIDAVLRLIPMNERILDRAKAMKVH